MNCKDPIVIRRTRLGIPTLECVPCGKCELCLKRKRDNYMIRSLEESKKYDSCYFVTLTYREDAVPTVFDEDGELIEESLCPLVQNPEKFRKEFGMTYQLDGDIIEVDDLTDFDYDCYRFNRDIDKNTNFVTETNLYDVSELGTQYDAFVDTENASILDSGEIPFNVKSLRIKDVVDWKKRCKAKLEYDKGEKLKFSYLIAGEYGPRTLRPHYHCLFYGLSQSEMNYFIQDWDKNFGHVDCKSISYDDIVRTSRYVSKYIVKGKKFENPNCAKGYCETPRKLVSVGYGMFSPDRQKQYLRDLVGDANVMLCENGDDIDKFPLSQVKDTVDRIVDKGFRYKLEGTPYVYSLPLYLRQKLFYKKVTKNIAINEIEINHPDEEYYRDVFSGLYDFDDEIEKIKIYDVENVKKKNVVVYRPNALYNLVMVALQCKVSREFIEKCESLAAAQKIGDDVEKSYAITSRLSTIEKDSMEIKCKIAEENYKSNLRKSIF